MMQSGDWLNLQRCNMLLGLLAAVLCATGHSNGHLGGKAASSGETPDETHGAWLLGWAHVPHAARTQPLS